MKKQNLSWTVVVISAFFEIIWVIGLKHADNWWTWAATVIAIAISFTGMIWAGRVLPVGTVYAVFVGLGAAGVVCSEILFFDEPMQLSKLILIGVLLVGVIGLKIVTDDKEQKGEEG